MRLIRGGGGLVEAENEDRGDLNTAASQDHRGTSNLEGKRNY
jgi:hypothetical protein